MADHWYTVTATREYPDGATAVYVAAIRTADAATACHRLGERIRLNDMREVDVTGNHRHVAPNTPAGIAHIEAHATPVRARSEDRS